MFRNSASAKSLGLASALFGFVALDAATASAVSGVEMYRNDAQRYGRFEARIQFAPGDGIISSFFLWKSGSELADAYWNEIDIEKVGANCMSYSSNALYGMPEAGHTQEIPAGVDLCTGYHTHAIEWTPTYLAWLLDGAEVRRLTGADLQAFEDNALPGMQFRFNLWVGSADFGGTFAAESLPVHQYINWVSYSAYTPGAGEGGSDFSPTWREDFDAPLGGSWALGTWDSPYGNSVYTPTNLTVVDGKAVLSLTPDDALGFTGQAPVDPSDADPGNTGGAAGFAGNAGLGGGGTSGIGGASGIGGTPGTGGMSGVSGTSGNGGVGGLAGVAGAAGTGGTPPVVTPPAATGGAAPIAPSVPPLAMGGAPAVAPSSSPIATVVSPAPLATEGAPVATAAEPASTAPGVAPTTTESSASADPIANTAEDSDGCNCTVGARRPAFSAWVIFSVLAFGGWLRIRARQLSTKCKARSSAVS